MACDKPLDNMMVSFVQFVNNKKQMRKKSDNNTKQTVLS